MSTIFGFYCFVLAFILAKAEFIVPVKISL